jgi:SAM-dependent methyltransferase
MALRGFGLGLGVRARRLFARPEPRSLTGPRIPSPEMVMENSGGMDQATFLRMGDEVLHGSFIGIAGLSPDGAVLDVGCGCGKVARPLAEFLSPAGLYHGIDIGADCIAWCRREYAELPNFHFHHADLFSTRYTPDGAASAATYRFPAPEGVFDLAFLGSVFTHMLPDEVENYLREIARALKPGGKVLSTWFLLDDESRANVEADRTDPSFHHMLPGGSGCRVQLADVPEDAIAYEQAFLQPAFQQAGLELVTVDHGQWGRGGLVPHWQDSVWGRKPV